VTFSVIAFVVVFILLEIQEQCAEGLIK